jgi:hypothetical protein
MTSRLIPLRLNELLGAAFRGKQGLRNGAEPLLGSDIRPFRCEQLKMCPRQREDVIATMFSEHRHLIEIGRPTLQATNGQYLAMPRLAHRSWHRTYLELGNQAEAYHTSRPA